jgi:hypothetical protein
MFRASDRAGSIISDKVTTKPKRTIPENLLLLIISPPFVLRLLNDDRPVWMLRAEKTVTKMMLKIHCFQRVTIGKNAVTVKR